MDITKPLVSPIDPNVCINEEEYFAFYEHGLGLDCMVGTADDGPLPIQYCPPAFEYNFEFCECVQKDACVI